MLKFAIEVSFFYLETWPKFLTLKWKIVISHKLAQESSLWLLCRWTFGIEWHKSYFLPCDLNQNFQDQKFNVLTSRKLKKLGTYHFSISLLCRLIFAIEWHNANVVVNDLDLNFQGQICQMAVETSIGWKMQTLLFPSDRQSCICQHMAQLQMLYVMTLTNIFKFAKFAMEISGKRWTLAKSVHIWRLYRTICAIECDNCD